MGHALDGVRVLELAQLAAVPMAGRLLADLGADVIHIEHPARGDVLRVVLAGQGAKLDGPNYIWENYNRNKRSMTLDVSKEHGLEILRRLVESSDVFLTNMRPFEIERYQLQYESLKTRNPRLIYGSLGGLGVKGPEKDEPGYDKTGYWARSGVACWVAPPDSPPDIQVGGFGDNMGGMLLAFAIMTALYDRERTGMGQEVDISLFQTGVFQMSWSVAETLVARERLRTSREDMLNSLMNPYMTSDGRWLLLVILQPDRYWSDLCKAIDRQDLEHDPRFSTFQARLENHLALFKILEATFMSRTLVEWKARLTRIPYAPIQTLTDVIRDPQAVANEFFPSVDHPRYGPMQVVANPLHLSRTPPTIRTMAPEFGQHTEEVLTSMGYSWKDIERFKEEHVIA